MLSIILYLIADIGCGWWGAMLCQNTFSVDLRIFLNLREVITFVKINTFITCLISGFIRATAFILKHNIVVDPKALFYIYLNFWLADLNAVLILSGFLLSWIYVPFSRENISERTIKKFSVIMLLAFIVIFVLFMKNHAMLYLIAVAIIGALYFSWIYGHLVATALLFIISNLCLAHFVAFETQHLLSFNTGFYPEVAIGLLLFALCTFYIGHVTLDSKKA